MPGSSITAMYRDQLISSPHFSPSSSILPTPNINSIDDLRKCITRYSPHKRTRIIEAAQFAQKMHEGQYRDSGEPYFLHPLQVAGILIDMKIDVNGVIAGLLHDILEDTNITYAELSSQFNKTVAILVNGVTNISSHEDKSAYNKEQYLEKILSSIERDVRVIFIKFADKLHNMRTLQFKPHAQRLLTAQECFERYVPFARQLGISWLENELQELSFFYLNPKTYTHIANFIAHHMTQAEIYLNMAKQLLFQEAKKINISIDVHTRVKRTYSVFHKLERDKKSLAELYDLLGVRILCKSEIDCYTVLEMIHHLWPPVKGRFKDYIAAPKENHYQSLHTTVYFQQDNLLEIQIRSYTMHQFAERGVAAHWHYKRSFSPFKIGVRHSNIYITHTPTSTHETKMRKQSKREKNNARSNTEK